MYHAVPSAIGGGIGSVGERAEMADNTWFLSLRSAGMSSMAMAPVVLSSRPRSAASLANSTPSASPSETFSATSARALAASGVSVGAGFSAGFGSAVSPGLGSAGVAGAGGVLAAITTYSMFFLTGVMKRAFSAS